MNNSIRRENLAIISLILGILGMIAWIIPIIGAAITIIGLVLSIKGLKSIKKGIAIAGMVLCIIGLVATIINGTIGAYKGAHGLLFQNSILSNNNAMTTSNTLIDKVIFCQKVDKNLKPINVATAFPAGQFYVELKNSSPFHTTKINVTIYAESGTAESIVDSNDEQVNQNWNTFSIPITLINSGQYKVIFTRLSDNKELGEGKVTIKEQPADDNLTSANSQSKDNTTDWNISNLDAAKNGNEKVAAKYLKDESEDYIRDNAKVVNSPEIINSPSDYIGRLVELSGIAQTLNKYNIVGTDNQLIFNSDEIDKMNIGTPTGSGAIYMNVGPINSIKEGDTVSVFGYIVGMVYPEDGSPAIVNIVGKIASEGIDLPNN